MRPAPFGTGKSALKQKKTRLLWETGLFDFTACFSYKPVSLFGNRITTTRFKRTRLISVVDLDDVVNMRFFSDFVLMK
jgi:hypothetical protein